MNMLANFTEGWDFFIFSFIRDTGGNFSILKGIYFFFPRFREFLSCLLTSDIVL